MNTTLEKYESYQQQVQELHNKHGKKKAIAKVCGIVGAIAFLLFSFLLTYGALSYFDSAYLTEEQSIMVVTQLNDLCKPLLSSFQFGAQPWYIVLPACLIAVILVPFVCSVLAALIAGACYKEDPLTVTQDHPIATLKALIDITKDTTNFIKDPLEDRKLLISLLYTIPLGALTAYGLFSGQYGTEDLILFSMCLVFFFAILFGVYRVPLNIFCALCKLLWKQNDAPAETLTTQLNAALTNEKRMAKDAADREQKEEAEKLRKKGDELYQQAIAGEEPDEALIRKAADMGSYDACLYYGRQLMGKWSSGLLTREEKKSCVKRAAKYLEGPATTSTEGKFLWLMARAQYESHINREWKEMLSEVRSIKNSGQLPEEYEETCDILLKYLVGIVDHTS